MTTKIPITVGIIGHIDAIITDKHTELITGLFDDIHTRYPNSPVCLFSQLARGADTFVAELFLELKEKTNRDYDLIVPLPFTLDRYLQDFTEKGSKEKFEYLLSKASRNFVLDNGSGHSDNDLYRAGGKFVADSSIILVAVWENRQNGKKGGTGDVVTYKISGAFEDDEIENIFDQEGSLISLTCNRVSDIISQSIYLPVGQLLDIIKKDVSINKTLDKIEQLNTSAKSVDRSLLEQSAGYLYPQTNQLNECGEQLRQYYAITDSLALTNQKGYNNIIGWLFVLGMIIIGVFGCYKHLEMETGGIALLFSTLVLMYLGYLTTKLPRYGKNHLQFLEDRVLAEALRIQFFWNLGDMQKPVSNHILRIHKTEFNWIKHLMQAIYGTTYSRESSGADTATIMKYWLTDQMSYFERTIPKVEKKERRYNNYSVSFLSIALVIMFFMLFDHPGPATGDEADNTCYHITIVIIDLFLGAFALLRAFVHKKGYQQILNQYSLMKDIYKATIKKIKEIEQQAGPELVKRHKIRKLYESAGREALIENGNWYLIFKEKEPEMEIGG